MSKEFSIVLSVQEKEYLHQLVLWSILRRLNGEVELPDSAIPVPPTAMLKEELGAFVTLNRKGVLRGCIGNVVGTQPLYITIANMALAAAFEDPRFPPLEPEESEDLEISISIMGPVTDCPDPQLVEIGKHGLIIRKGSCSGLLLPQVPVELNWDRETFLQQTCAKAGLPPTAWQEADTDVYWFEAVVF